jgi:hypothetical protein
MGASPDTQIDDQEVLDRLFDLAVERIEEGLPVEAEHLIQGRHELRPQVEQLIRLA